MKEQARDCLYRNVQSQTDVEDLLHGDMHGQVKLYLRRALLKTK